MRVLYVHERFGSLGGAEANVVIVADELSKRGHDVGILHGPGTGRGEDHWQDVFPFRHPFDESNAARSVREAVKAFQPDVIFVHKIDDLSVIEALVGCGYPLIRMVHDHDIYCMRSYKYNYFTRKICTRPASLACVFPCMGCLVKGGEGSLPVKWASYRNKKREIALNHQFDRMCVVTSYMRDELIRNGFSRDRIEIHPPVPRSGQAGLRSSFSDRNLIVYAGQIIRGKGVDVLLRSLSKVTEPFECIILGDGNQREECERLSQRLGLNDRVHFKGFVPQEELKGYYQDCSLVALSSVWPEPIATIGLEVMRYALPVVAFDAGGIKDWLKDGENGFLVPWMDEDAYAGRIDTLLSDKIRARQMGQAGFDLVSREYDFEGYLAGIENLFASVMEEQRLKTA